MRNSGYYSYVVEITGLCIRRHRPGHHGKLTHAALDSHFTYYTYYTSFTAMDSSTGVPLKVVTQLSLVRRVPSGIACPSVADCAKSHTTCVKKHTLSTLFMKVTFN